ncbi:hypothetical protein AO385_1776 [Moraxella catarrhalis]|uniref:Uncharacterized protein n=1 Tax=Moraxella catarrhalis TaxID=480 RepID=A0A198UV28_MORCA|nr:hypothetical protein AO383_1795 [Moraxella catarrhalis]OAU97007.1 hypothetical protein AO385_1776 [Moraxella catarrhalis]OAU97991.1 hypothetical protein AO384_0238 [Moraxella catarrhalis]OAV00384.1 hypothetical protein AO382_1534 [Moraxella catarrhalis]
MLSYQCHLLITITLCKVFMVLRNQTQKSLEITGKNDH